MNVSKLNFHITISLALYFGWLLSFPFYGPVSSVAAPLYEFRGLTLPFVFSLSQTLSFLCGGLLLKNVKLWNMLIVVGLGVTLAVGTALLFSPPSIWPWAMVVLGVAAAMYTLGWAYPYATFVSMADRLKLMAAVIMGANIIYVFFNILSHMVSPALLLFLVGIPLWLAVLPAIYLFQPGTNRETIPPSRSAIANGSAPIPVPLLLILCLFVTGLYLCSGFMYNIMQPYLTTASPQHAYFRYIPYIAVILIMWYFGGRLQRYFSIYMGVSLLGLAFVSFALGYNSTAGILMTTSLIEAAFAFLDLFVWITLGDLAFIYGGPFQFFGFVLAAMLFSIVAGEFIGTQLLQIGEHYRFVTALFAATAIYLTFSVIPWLNEHIQKGLQGFLKHYKDERDDQKAGESHPGRTKKLLLKDHKLTPRETEIAALLLKGLTNKEIASQLFISENTLKTHLRNIYPKYGVSQKRELLALALDKNKDQEIPGL